MNKKAHHGKLGSPFEKANFRSFTDRNFARLRQKYPFLPKSQIRHKVKTLWEKLNMKNNGKKICEDWKKKKNGILTGRLYSAPFKLSFLCHRMKWVDF